MRSSLRIKNNRGFNLIEFGVVIALIAILMIAMWPQIQSAFLSTKVDALNSHVEEFRRGMNECRARFNAYTRCTTAMLSDEGYVGDALINKMGEANPWGGSYAISTSAQTWTLAVAGISDTAACKRSQTTYSEIGGVTAVCSGTTLTLTFRT